MAAVLLIFTVVMSTTAVLEVEGTAKGAVPLDTLTFDKVFLKSCYDHDLPILRKRKYRVYRVHLQNDLS